MLKRLLALLFAAIIVAATALPAMAVTIDSSSSMVLSNMSDEDQLQFLEEQGIKVPDVYADYIIKWIALVEADPNRHCDVSNPVLYDLALQVQDVIISYADQRGSSQTCSIAATYTLQDSTVYGAWSDSYIEYNCYAYALNLTDDFHWPGRFSNTPNQSDFTINDSIYSLACDVMADLKSSTFSNNCVYVTSTRPTSLSSSQSCICIRKGSEDFYFMKLDGSSWYHKPSWTNPLKYKYTPSNSRIWTNENSKYGVAYAGSTTYTSDIYYIVYQKNHGATTYTQTGNNYHSGSRHYYEYGDKCVCGYFLSTTWTSVACSGPPCSGIMGITPTPEII